MRTTLRHGLTAALLAASSLSVGLAAAAPIPFAQLPIQAAPRLPEASAQPMDVPAKERVPGIFVAERRAAPQFGGYPALGLFAASAPAERFLEEPYAFMTSIEQSSAPCFFVANPLESASLSESERLEWPEFSQAYLELGVYSGPEQTQGVRLERLVTDARGARLEATEMWVDPDSTGVRLIGRSSLALTRVAEPTEGVEVYIARTGEARVEVVVRRGPSHYESELYEAMPEDFNPNDGSLGMFSSELQGVVGLDAIFSQCGHLRFRLEPSTGAPEPGDLRFASRETASLSTHVLLGLVKARRAQEAYDAFPVEVSMRQVTLNFGFSRLASDEEPLLSLSYRWTSPRQTVFLSPMLAQRARQEAAARFIDLRE